MMSVKDNLKRKVFFSSPAKRIKLDTNFLFKPLEFQKIKLFSTVKKTILGGRMVCDEDGNIVYSGDTQWNLLKLNTATNILTQPKTTGVRHRGTCPSLEINEGRLIAFGGSTAHLGEQGFTNQVSAFDLESLHWHKIMTTGPAPAPRVHSATVIHEENLYVIGGWNDMESFFDVHKLDLRTSTWETLWKADVWSTNPDDPKTSIGHQVVVHGNKLIFFDVKDYLDTFFYLNKLPSFDLKSRTWACLNTIGDSSSKISNFPSRHWEHCVVQRGHEAFICGHDAFSGIWKLNLIDLRWTKLGIRYPAGLFLRDVALSPNGCLFVTFGEHGGNHLQPGQAGIWKCWLTVPTLKEMAWESVGHFQPKYKFKNNSKDQLIKSGIPRDLVRRLDFSVYRNHQVLAKKVWMGGFCVFLGSFLFWSAFNCF